MFKNRFSKFRLTPSQLTHLSLTALFITLLLMTHELFGQSTNLYQDQVKVPVNFHQKRPDTRMTSTYTNQSRQHVSQQYGPAVQNTQQRSGRPIMRPYVQPKPLVSMRYTGTPGQNSQVQTVHKGPIAQSIREHSRLVVVSPPERRYARHDLITIIISENTSDSSESKIETEKEMDVSASIDEFPNLDVRNLFRAIIGGNTLTNPPRVKASMENEFTGEGTHENTSSITAQITAEVIDIKPNGNLVLEARKNIRVDKEVMGIILTGICRPQDIADDNTILSGKVANLRLIKGHEGELRKIKKKGPVTKFFEWLVPF